MFKQPTIPQMPPVQDHRKSIENALTINGLPLPEYERLREADRELTELKKQISACAKVKTEEIDKKERKFRDERRKLQENWYTTGKEITDEEQRKIENLENEYLEELEHPQIIINAGKAEKLILSYIGYGMEEEDRKKYGFYDRAPKGSQVKIE